MAQHRKGPMKRYLLACDFDQTLSFNDSGVVLSELLGLPGFRERIAGLSRTHLVQQGAELAYLLLHDPAYRQVRKEHLVEVGKRVRLKMNLPLQARRLHDLVAAQLGLSPASPVHEHCARVAAHLARAP